MSIANSERPTLGVPITPFRRTRSNALLGGVCSGLARRLGIRERTVRIVFVVATLIWGAALVIYTALWMLTPRAGESESIAQRISARRRHPVLFFAILVIGVLLIVALYGDSHRRFDLFMVSLSIAVTALGIVWWGSSSDEKGHVSSVAAATPLRSLATRQRGRVVIVRVLVGMVLVAVGLNVVSRVGGVWGSAVPAVLGALVVVVGVALLLAPWWLETALDLSRERRDRVRAEERASMVAHLHDSVLQTLTLIERVAHNEADVRRLARNQERELRQWLYEPTPSSSSDATLGSLLRELQSDVENDYGIDVELVLVGDCRASGAVTTLVLAAREAVLNAAKWSQAPKVSIYAETSDNNVEIFVRDKGVGFDRANVSSDRHGITTSIEQRALSIGARARVSSQLGEGTEVALELHDLELSHS
jgi:signal transduction histidine kinase